jgi:hypothetical protein
MPNAEAKGVVPTTALCRANLENDAEPVVRSFFMNSATKVLNLICDHRRNRRIEFP